MESIAEITTPYCVAMVRFDDGDEKEIARIEKLLIDLAEEGLVYGLEFHIAQ